jgi:hypothetical protein
VTEIWIVLMDEGYDEPEAFGPFASEEECYAFAAHVSQRPNDWTPIRVQTPTTD